MPKNKVFIVGGDFGVSTMYQKAGWETTDVLNKATIVQFTGGADVSPSLYGQKAHPKTRPNIERDRREVMIFGHCVANAIPMSGICRGAQFINVMCGGSMWQDVDGHILPGTHEVIDEINTEVFDATSTHHQIMRPNKRAMVLASAYISKKRECYDAKDMLICSHSKNSEGDPEIVYYAEENALCFQPHPELPGHTKLAGIYFDYMDKYVLGKDY